ncbi:MAG: restriction endonuclease subunit S [Gammaproteobacteria bacterium]|nr:restriction endonuclease subunit S [Gammaproteobacteria bacterium]
MSEWREVSLGSLLKLITKGTTPPKGKGFVEHGINYIKSDAINYDGRIDVTKFVAIDKETHHKFKRSQLEELDILFSMAGAYLGKNGIVLKNMLPANTNQALAILRVNQDLALPYYISQFLSQTSMIDYINNMSGQSAQPNINFQEISSIEVNLPPLPEQKAIAEVLSSLDDKIDLLHRQNKTLEQMAETLFRQWFVEEAGEDWGEGVISDLIDFNPKRVLAKGTIATYLEMTSLNTQTFNPTGWYAREFKSGTKFINEDTLLARITPCLENGKTAYVTFLEEKEVAWGSTEYIVMRSKEGVHPFFAYTLARNKDFREYAEGCLAGSSGRQRIDLGHLKNFDISIPPQNIIEDFNKTLETIVPKLKMNATQIRTLQSLRDTLLPKLMNGEVRVSYDKETSL